MSFDLEPIDPVEAITASVGVYPVIDKDPGKVRMAKIHAAHEIATEVESLAKQLAADELQEVPADDVDYRAVLETLIQSKFDVDRTLDIASAFPRQAATEAAGYLSFVGVLVKQLAAKFPIPVYTTFAGTSPMVPSDVATWRWASLLQVVDRPLDVFPLIATGAITSNQAKAVRQIYPTLTRAIDSALQQATEAQRAKKKDYQLPPRAEHGMRTWFDRPSFSPAMMKTFQDNVKKVAQQKQAANARPAASPEPGVNELTSSQKSAYMTTGK